MAPGHQSLYIGTSSTVLELEVAREEHAPSYRQPGGAHTGQPVALLFPNLTKQAS